MIRRLLAYLPAALWAAALLLLGGQSQIRGPELPVLLDKAAHFGLYAGLGVLAGWGWLRARRWPPSGWILVLALLAGAVDEWHQASVPGRSAELADLAADALGIVVAFGMVSRWGRRSEEKRQTDES